VRLPVHIDLGMASTDEDKTKAKPVMGLIAQQDGDKGI
jgi:hypothetical protein